MVAWRCAGTFLISLFSLFLLGPLHSVVFPWVKIPPHIFKCFLLKIQGFPSFSISVNEPKSWTFHCIWYRKSGKRVYEIKRLWFSLYMALCIPIPLWQLTSYNHQDPLCRQRSSLPSSCLSITRVSALLLNGVMPHGDDFCRLLAHSLSFDYWLASCFSTIFSGRYL